MIQTSVDVEDYITKAIVVTRGTGSATTATTSTGSTAFRDLVGNTTHVERYIDAPSELAANASLIGTAALNRFNAERRDLRLNSRTYNVSRFVTPGDYIFAFDLVSGLTDPSTQIFFRDGVITPLTLRVFGLTFPIQRGMGVYARRSTGVGTASYTDLTDYVVFEDGDVSWEVGAARRPLVGTNAGPTTEGTVAYLGVNPQISARSTDPEAWTQPTLVNSWVDYGGANAFIAYRKVGDMVQLRGTGKDGTLNTTAFTLPVGYRPTASYRFGTADGTTTVDSSGNVAFFAPANTIFSVDGVSFTTSN